MNILNRQFRTTSRLGINEESPGINAKDQMQVDFSLHLKPAGQFQSAAEDIHRDINCALQIALDLHVKRSDGSVLGEGHVSGNIIQAVERLAQCTYALDVISDLAERQSGPFKKEPEKEATQRFVLGRFFLNLAHNQITPVALGSERLESRTLQ